MKKILRDTVMQFLKHTKAYHILKPHFRKDGLILMFHRLSATICDYNWTFGTPGLEISVEFLESIILYFKKLDYEFISLDQLYERLQHNSVEKPFVCFTFDDGYIDNYEIAYPVLKKHNIPFAT